MEKKVKEGEFIVNRNEENLIINNITVNRQLDKKSFISYFNNDLMPYSDGDQVVVFNKSYRIEDMDFWIIVGFENDNIVSIELENSDKNLRNSYSNWSNNRVKLKKESHDVWLKKLLGDPDIVKDNEIIYNLQWGTITSYVDPRSGSVCISLRYKIILK